MLVRFRIRGSVPLTNGSGSDSFLIKDAKKITRRHNISSLKIYLFAKIMCKNCILLALFNPVQHLSDPYL
jgi:hypothetical protein